MYRVSLLTNLSKRMPAYWTVDPGGEDRYQQLATSSRQPTKSAAASRTVSQPNRKTCALGCFKIFAAALSVKKRFGKASENKYEDRHRPPSKLVWSPDGCPTPEQ